MTEFELNLLRTVERLDESYGVPIHQALEQEIGNSVSYGMLTSTLNELVDQGLLSYRNGEATPERGGRIRRYYQITGFGVALLNEEGRENDRSR